ncbi:MAG: hypothetical protein C0503_00235 [Gemmatimonas sp.]|nr:hypothetical protein [Gemmatimonas sp.]
MHTFFVMSSLRLRTGLVAASVGLAALSLSAMTAAAQQRPAAAQRAAVSIDWRLLGQMNPDTRVAPDSLKRLDGQRVRIPGFVVPLDDAQEDGAEFLLVPYYGACVHTPPPPPNQMAFVTMQGGRSIKLALFDAVWMEGTLRIVNYDSPYGSVGYTIEGLSMSPYTGR